MLDGNRGVCGLIANDFERFRCTACGKFLTEVPIKGAKLCECEREVITDADGGVRAVPAKCLAVSEEEPA